MKTSEKIKNMLLFTPNCRIGDVVYHVTDKAFESPLIVTNFNINYVNEDDEVKDFTVGCSFPDGRMSYFKSFELKIKEGED